MSVWFIKYIINKKQYLNCAIKSVINVDVINNDVIVIV